MQQRELKNKETKLIGGRVEIETYNRLRRAAFENNTSMASIMEDAIIKYLDELNKGNNNDHKST